MVQFIKNEVPVILTFIAGLIVILGFYLAVPALGELSNELVRWNVILAAFALMLGLGSVVSLHIGRIVKHERDAVYSYATLIALVIFVVVGISDTTQGSNYQWLYDSIFTPLASTTYATTVFFITSAAYRAFRIKNSYAAVLMVAAILTMMKVGIFAAVIPATPQIAAWIWDIPNTAGMRAVVIGTALSLAGNAFRVLTGLERGHLGGGE